MDEVELTRRNALLVVVSLALTTATTLASMVLLAIGPDRPAPGDVFAGVGGLSFAVLALAYGVVGALIAARMPGHRMGWLFCCTGVAIAFLLLSWQYGDVGLGSTSRHLPGASLAPTFPGEVAPGLIGLSLLLFPGGRLPSRRWRPAFAALVLGMAMLGLHDLFRPGTFDPPFAMASNPLGIPGTRAVLDTSATVGWLLMVAGVSLATASLVVRLRHARGVERQQLKVVLSAGALAAAIGTLAMASWLLWPQGALQVRMAVVGLSFAILPVAAGLSILRYHLYEIDVVIHRTLVYGALTVTLAGAYVGSVLTMQVVFNAVTGSSDLAVAVSTLAVAALFRPARARIQEAVDRRFYRRKYDAERTLESFSSRLKAKVALDAVSNELCDAVTETMQPTHLALWLRDPPRAKN